jgi:hypothetical protein
MKIHIDKIASSTINAGLEREVEVIDRVEPVLGNVVVVKALREKTVYDKLELVSGRMAKVSKDDVIAGVLGRRRALRGFVGEIPETLKPGDRVHVLNLGGVIGVVVSGNLDLGQPLLCEVVGSVARDGEIVSIAQDVPPPPDTLPDVPLILVEGTCMNSGKTHAAATLIQKLTQRGYRLNAAKLTGVACLRDTLNMDDHGAVRTASFLDCGLPSTIDVDDLPGIARAVLADLGSDAPDAIVVELGDGIIGHYGCDKILQDAEILRRTRAHVMCANDLVGAWGAQRVMKQWGLDIDVLCGPATDNEVGQAYAARELRLPAANARTDAHKLADLVEGLVW